MHVSLEQLEKYNQALLTLYSCDRLISLGQIILQAIHPLVPYESGAFFPIDPFKKTLKRPYCVNLPNELFQDYRNYYSQFDIYREIAFSQEAIPITDRASDFFRYYEWEKNEHRADFLLQNNMVHLAGIQLFSKGCLNGMVSIHRGWREPDFTDEEMFLLRMLSIHIESIYNRIQAESLFTSNRTNDASESLPGTALTDREKDIIYLLIEGYSNKEIGERLFISPETVKTHLGRLYRKMYADSRTDLVSKILRLGIPR